MSDELRERLHEVLAKADGLAGIFKDYTAGVDAVMKVLQEEFGEPETEYGIRWRNEDYVMPVTGDDVDYLRRELEGAAKYSISAKPHVRIVHYGPWRPIDMEEETQ